MGDPVAVFEAISVDTHGGSVLAVLSTAPRERFERRLVGAGYDPKDVHSVDFVPGTDPTTSAEASDGGRIRGDVAGLSMALVRRVDELADGGGVVYLESVGALVAAAGLESTCRLLVIVAARARAAGVRLVARLDPGTVDPAAAETLTEAFDRTVEGPSTGSSDGARE